MSPPDGAFRGDDVISENPKPVVEMDRFGKGTSSGNADLTNQMRVFDMDAQTARGDEGEEGCLQALKQGGGCFVEI